MADFSADLFYATAVELNRSLLAKQVSAREVAHAFVKRLEKLGPRYNALVLPLGSGAADAAAQVDRELKRERTRGPLQGVPYGVMDSLSVAGKPTAWGAAPFAGQRFKEDAEAIRRLRNIGALLTGKLAMVELAGGGCREASSSAQGPGLNPWDRARWTGGASSGPAAAVAAGLVTYALGLETADSILTPCAFCGVTGLRPTFGLVGRSGTMRLAWSMDKIGPVARSAEDCGHVLRAIAGGDPGDAGSVAKGFHFTPDYAPPLKDLRIGFASADFEQNADAPLRAPLMAALESIRQSGAVLSEPGWPDFPYDAVAGLIVSAEASAAFGDLLQSGGGEQLLDRRVTESLRAANRITAPQYLNAMRVRQMIKTRLAALFRGVDLLAAPTRFSIAPQVDQLSDWTTRPGSLGPNRGLSQQIAAGNLAGLPALTLPCGFAGGLPVGITLIGKAFSENVLLKVGMYYQSVTEWHRRRPPG